MSKYLTDSRDDLKSDFLLKCQLAETLGSQSSASSTSNDDLELEDVEYIFEDDRDINPSIKPTTKGITQDLELLPLPPDVKREAGDIYLKMNHDKKVNRGKCRKRVIFYCVFFAFINTHKPKIPTAVARLCDITKDDISKAFKVCNPIKTGYYPPKTIIPALDWIRGHIEEVGLSGDCYDDVYEFAESILAADPKLDEDNFSQDVSIAIISYYITLQGYNASKMHLEEIVDKSATTINKIISTVKAICNSRSD